LSKDGGEVSAGASRAAREASDAVASAAARRSEAASARGITHRGGDDRRGPKDKLGVVHHLVQGEEGRGGEEGLEALEETSEGDLVASSRLL
jgi:hypothetical protein